MWTLEELPMLIKLLVLIEPSIYVNKAFIINTALKLPTKPLSSIQPSVLIKLSSSIKPSIYLRWLQSFRRQHSFQLTHKVVIVNTVFDVDKASIINTAFKLSYKAFIINTAFNVDKSINKAFNLYPKPSLSSIQPSIYP